jgi:hypothetical protein
MNVQDAINAKKTATILLARPGSRAGIAKACGKRVGDACDGSGRRRAWGSDGVVRPRAGTSLTEPYAVYTNEQMLENARKVLRKSHEPVIIAVRMLGSQIVLL